MIKVRIKPLSHSPFDAGQLRLAVLYVLTLQSGQNCFASAMAEEVVPTSKRPPA